MDYRLLCDLFCGIGGVAEATRGVAESMVVSAIDIDQTAAPVYQANHGVTVTCRSLESARQIPSADCWWLSPPCQPYTRRGLRRADLDPRSAALARLIHLIDQQRPMMVALENVPGFADSTHHRQLVDVLCNAGYQIESSVLCPTQWGIPMRRQRFYLRARRDGQPITPVEFQSRRIPLRAFLDDRSWDDRTLQPGDALVQQYQRAMHFVDADDADAVAACFTSAYGKSVVRSGSYLRCRRRGIVRRFAPSEIGRLMGFRPDFRWPQSLNRRDQYRLLGNSLAVPVVQSVLQSLLFPSESQ